MFESPVEKQIGAAETKAAAIAAHFTFTNPDARIVTIAKPGLADLEICSMVSESSVDLIVLSTHGKGGSRRTLFGGVATKVLRHATCPVLLIRSGTNLPSPSEATPTWLPRKILVPVDFSPRAEAAIDCAVTLAAGCGGVVSLLHILEPRARMRIC